MMDVKAKTVGKVSEVKQKTTELAAVLQNRSLTLEQKFAIINAQIDEAYDEMKEADSMAAQMDILMTVLMVIVGAVSLYVGLLIISNVESSLPNETTDSETFNTISSNVDSAFVLIGVGFIVVAAGFIIGALITRLAPGLFNMNNNGK